MLVPEALYLSVLELQIFQDHNVLFRPAKRVVAAFVWLGYRPTTQRIPPPTPAQHSPLMTPGSLSPKEWVNV